MNTKPSLFHFPTIRLQKNAAPFSTSTIKPPPGQIINGDNTNNTINGSSLDDVIHGNGGKDTINGGSGDDTLFGDDGDDSIQGENGNDTIYGGNGSDYITDNDGNNVIDGGAGNDFIQVFGKGATATISGGSGDDFIMYSFASGSISGDGGNDDISVFVDAIQIGQKDPVLTINGGDGNDVISYNSLLPENTPVFVSGGQGQDTFKTSSLLPTFNFQISDFQTGANGDFIDLSGVINGMGSPTDLNPFAKGYLKLVQVGADTKLYIDRSKIDGNTKALEVFTFNNTDVSKFTSANFIPAMDPKGSLAPIVTYGDANDNLIYGGRTNDTLFGGAGNDKIDGGAGSDTIDGGAGLDTAEFPFSFSHYQVQKSGNQYLVKSDFDPSIVDRLTNIEKISFENASINLEVQSKAKSLPTSTLNSIVELYVAFFGRIPDAEGMSYWIDQARLGKTINAIAEDFYAIGASDDFSSRTGFSKNMENEAFIHTFYRNVLGRKDGADQEGLNYWNAKLSQGLSTRASLAQDIINVAHTFKNNPTYGYVADLLDNTLYVGKKVAIDWGFTPNSDAYGWGRGIAYYITPSDTSVALEKIGVADGAILIL